MLLPDDVKDKSKAGCTDDRSRKTLQKASNEEGPYIGSECKGEGREEEEDQAEYKRCPP